MEIRRAQNDEEYRQAAGLHKQYIPTGFLSSLGIGFLTRMYAFMAADESAVLLVAVEAGTVAGFITGTVDVRRFYRRFIRENIFLGVMLIPRLASPQRVNKIIETLLYPRRSENMHLPSAELLSLVVEQRYRKQGIAAALYEGLVQFFRQQDIPEFKIIVGDTLTPALHFYEKMGAVKNEKIEMHKGSRSWVMRCPVQ